MNGRIKFNKSETEAIKTLLQKIRESDRETQKQLRGDLRNTYQFFITDFTASRRGFTSLDFDDLVQNGRVTITNL